MGINLMLGYEGCCVMEKNLELDSDSEKVKYIVEQCTHICNNMLPNLIKKQTSLYNRSNFIVSQFSNVFDKKF